MKLTNRIYHSLFTAMLAIAVASCTDDFQPEPSASRILLPGEYRFIICQDDEGLGSRVMYEDEKHSRFETGDRIGVFAEDETQIQNDVFSAKSIAGEDIQVLAPPQNLVSGLLNTIPPESGKNGYTFYFPLNPEWKRSDLMKGTGFSYAVEADQSTKENYQKSDFLWHYMNPKPDVETQTVAMHHLMANIVVKIHKDSIDTSEDPTTGKPKGVTLRNIKCGASDIKFAIKENDVMRSNGPGEMNYKINDNQAPSDIKMYCQGESSDYLVYRAAIPAWTTISADSEIFTVNLFDRNGKSEEVTYKLAGDLSLKDGHYYTFTLRSAVKPAIPDVSDDDSWVLDVFDPETGDIVGLLCREYIRYQPEVGLEDTEYITGTPIKDSNSKYISSQAWVFYNLKKGFESEGIVDLDHGTILRILYDFRVCAQYNVQNYQLFLSKWPAPHLNFRGSGAYLLVNHGHIWDNGVWGETTPGVSSSLYQWQNNEFIKDGHNDAETGELYMHGGTIEWSKTIGKHPIYSDQQLEFFNISNFTMPEKKVTNYNAMLYGHIAIDGDNIYVSYEPFDGTCEISNPAIKVGNPVPHKLHDVRGTEINDYPIVKIGYNNFWMSKSLRTEVFSNGKSLAYLYSKIDENNQSAEYYDDEWEPGYIYSKRDQLDINTQVSDNEKDSFFPKLYNYVAFENSEFLPNENKIDATGKNRFIVMHPTSKNFGTMLNYFGTTFSGKLCSDEFFPQVSNGAYTVNSNEIEAALRKCEYTNNQNNVFIANISGFNLLPMGGFVRNTFGSSFGEQFNLWLKIPDDEKFKTIKEGDNDKTVMVQHSVTFNSWTPFQTNVQLDQVFDNRTEGTNDNNRNMLLTHRFMPARFLMRMKYQQNTGGSISTVKSVLRKSSKPTDNTTNNQSKIVPVSIVKSTARK